MPVGAGAAAAAAADGNTLSSSSSASSRTGLRIESDKVCALRFNLAELNGVFLAKATDTLPPTVGDMNVSARIMTPGEKLARLAERTPVPVVVASGLALDGVLAP